jgi:hypothetical protein
MNAAPSHLQCGAGRGRSRPGAQIGDPGEERGGQGPVAGRKHRSQVFGLGGSRGPGLMPKKEAKKDGKKNPGFEDK